MAEPVMLEVRERRSLFGRIVKWVFLAFQVVMILLMLGTCAAIGPFLTGPDPEVAMGAGMFGAMAIAVLWTLWPVGTLVLGLLVLFTRGRRRLIPAPLPPSAEPPPARRGGTVPEIGPGP